MPESVSIQLNFFGPYIESKSSLHDVLKNEKAPGHEVLIMLLDNLFNLPYAALSKETLDRYIEATTRETHIPIAPTSEEIVNRLLIPLREAKRSYCLAEYLSTIALCGMIAEMLAILVWKINNVIINEEEVDEHKEEKLFGRTFDKLGQQRRLEVLMAFKFINEGQYTKFQTIKNIRNKYLHSWEVPSEEEQGNAIATLKESFILFKEIAEIRVTEGVITLNPSLIALIKLEGEIEPERDAH